MSYTPEQPDTLPISAYLKSLWLLFRGAARHWGLAVSGVISSALGWILPVFGVEKITPTLLWWMGIGLLIWALVRVFHDVRIERDALMRQLLPVLSIALGNRQRPFLQINDFIRPTADDGHEYFQQRLWRVGICNTGGPIDDVALIAESCTCIDEPTKALPYFFPHHSLRAMDNRSGPTGKFLVPAGDGPVVWVDVVSEHQDMGDMLPDFSIQYAQADLPNVLARGRYRLMLRLEAGALPPVRKMIRLEYDDNNQLIVRED